MRHATSASVFRRVRRGLLLLILPWMSADTLPAVAAPGLEAGEVFRECPECPEMVVVPAGSFLMGSSRDSDEAWDGHQEPKHRVTVGYAFAVGVYEVTFAEWDACVRQGGCAGYEPFDEGWGREKRPVLNVNWEDARAYTDWLTDRTGHRYRLLTEAEWEYTARAGTKTARYWNDVALLRDAEQCRYANGLDPAAAGLDGLGPHPCRDGHAHSAPVGSFLPNQFGLYDILGNVWEWVDDCWNDSYVGAPTDGSGWYTGDCSRRVRRGGGWSSKRMAIHSAFRAGAAAGERSSSPGLPSSLGFRVARTMD